MKKFWAFTAIMLVFGIGFASAQIWESSAPANFRADIKKNQWSPGYQWEGTAAWVAKGNQLQAGQKIEVELTFTSNRAIPELEVVFVDGTPAVDYWKELASDWAKIQNIPANTPVSTKATFDIVTSASSAAREANKLIFDYQSPDQEVTLTFSKLTIRRIQ